MEETNECCCESSDIVQDWVDKDDSVILTGLNFIEMKGGLIHGAGVVTGKFDGKDLYEVGLIDIETGAGLQYTKLLPLELFDVPEFRF